VALRRHAKIDPGNPAHVGAPMPGAIVTVTVHPGQRVTKGTPIASIEAMKMETVLFADRDATVASVHVKPGDQVEAKESANCVERVRPSPPTPLPLAGQGQG